MYVGFISLGKAYDRVDREVLLQVLRMNDVGGKPMNGTYANSLLCAR